jgi:hypothetical protein
MTQLPNDVEKYILIGEPLWAIKVLLEQHGLTFDDDL